MITDSSRTVVVVVYTVHWIYTTVYILLLILIDNRFASWNHHFWTSSWNLYRPSQTHWCCCVEKCFWVQQGGSRRYRSVFLLQDLICDVCEEGKIVLSTIVLFNVTITRRLCGSEGVGADDVNEKRYIFVISDVITGTLFKEPSKTLAFRAQVLMVVYRYSNQGNVTVPTANEAFFYQLPIPLILFWQKYIIIILSNYHHHCIYYYYILSTNKKPYQLWIGCKTNIQSWQ